MMHRISIANAKNMVLLFFHQFNGFDILEWYRCDFVLGSVISKFVSLHILACFNYYLKYVRIMFLLFCSFWKVKVSGN